MVWCYPTSGRHLPNLPWVVRRSYRLASHRLRVKIKIGSSNPREDSLRYSLTAECHVHRLRRRSIATRIKLCPTSRGFLGIFTERSQNNYCRLPHTNLMQPAGGFTRIWLKRRAFLPRVATPEHRNQDKGFNLNFPKNSCIIYKKGFQMIKFFLEG